MEINEIIRKLREMAAECKVSPRTCREAADLLEMYAANNTEKGKPMNNNVRDALPDIMAEAKRTDPETGQFSEYLADFLIDRGVTINPVVPGLSMGHDMAEICYRNGAEAMREKVVDYLRSQKETAFGPRRNEIQDMIEVVRRL